MSLSEFRRRFLLLANSDLLPPGSNSDDQTIAKNILLDADIDDSSYRIGISEVSHISPTVTTVTLQT